MFTGIVEEVGYIKNIKKSTTSTYINIKANKVLVGTKIGDSISVNGVCLTVIEIDGNGFTADVMNETMKRSILGQLSIGSKVNLERAMASDGRFGGHIVSGHIDGTGTILKRKKDGIALWFTISASKNIMKYIIEKGSIAIDGISLTVANLSEKAFMVSVIPHTLKNTCLLDKKENDSVNLENDCIGKYVEKLFSIEDKTHNYEKETPKQNNLNEGFLIQHGFK